jgi:superfamily I DNA and/or RNA helicase
MTNWVLVIAPVLSIGSLIFFVGFYYRTLKSLDTHVHNLNNWRISLEHNLDQRYVLKNELNLQLKLIDSNQEQIKSDVKEIKEYLLRALVSGQNQVTSITR